jgi:peptide/nickel transport system permease protein
MIARTFIVIVMAAIMVGALLPAPAADVGRVLGDAQGLHLLGFDEVGRSLLPQLWRSAGLSLCIAVAAAAVSTVIALLLGCLASLSARRQRWLDTLILRAADTAAALPVLPMFIVMGAVLLRDSSLRERMAMLIVGLGLCGWPSLTRIVRGAALETLTGAPVRAAIGFGANSVHLVIHHVVPALVPLLQAHIASDIAGNLVSEAALSLLGVGLTPPDSTLGTMTAAAWPLLTRDPPLLLLPLAVMITIAWLLQRLRVPE